MPFTGHEVWAHDDSYPHAVNCDDHLMLGRMRHCNDMGYMTNPLRFDSAAKWTGNIAPISSVLIQQEMLRQKTVNENLKRHGTVENISEVDEACEHHRAKRRVPDSYDFLINNVGYDGSNLHQMENIAANIGKKRGAYDESAIDCKRFCMKEKDEEEMEVDGPTLPASQDQPENSMDMPQTAISTAGIVPTQDNIQFQAQNYTAEHLNSSGSGLEQPYLWQNNFKQHILYNSPNSINTLNGSCYTRSVEPLEISSSVDDVEFMYQATHGGNLMRHQSTHLGDDL